MLMRRNEELKNKTNVKGDRDYSEKLGWFDRLPMGVHDSMGGCFIKEAGDFPPPIVFCHAGADWYIKLDFDYYKWSYFSKTTVSKAGSISIWILKNVSST